MSLPRLHLYYWSCDMLYVLGLSIHSFRLKLSQDTAVKPHRLTDQEKVQLSEPLRVVLTPQQSHIRVSNTFTSFSVPI